MKNLYILRAVPGSGKTTFAETLKGYNPNIVICSADDYFLDENGVYNFDVSELKYAHKFCQEKATSAMVDGLDVIISNTNINNKDMKYYEAIGKENGYMIFHIVLENRHGNKNIHGVPSEKLNQMKESLKRNILL